MEAVGLDKSEPLTKSDRVSNADKELEVLIVAFTEPETVDMIT